MDADVAGEFQQHSFKESTSTVCANHISTYTHFQTTLCIHIHALTYTSKHPHPQPPPALFQTCTTPRRPHAIRWPVNLSCNNDATKYILNALYTPTPPPTPPPFTHTHTHTHTHALYTPTPTPPHLHLFGAGQFHVGHAFRCARELVMQHSHALDGTTRPAHRTWSRTSCLKLR